MVNNNWLRTNWLILSILLAILSLGVAWGVTRNQQTTNTTEIEKKLDKEIFQMYSEQQTVVLGEIKTTLKEQRLEQRTDMKEIKKLIKDGR